MMGVSRALCRDAQTDRCDGCDPRAMATSLQVEINIVLDNLAEASQELEDPPWCVDGVRYYGSAVGVMCSVSGVSRAAGTMLTMLRT
jgi:hypothetical protein